MISNFSSYRGKDVKMEQKANGQYFIRTIGGELLFAGNNYECLFYIGEYGLTLVSEEK